MEKKFIRVRSIKDIIISTSLIIIGLTLIIVPENTVCQQGGFTLIAVGIILLCLLKSNYKNIETRDIFLKKEFFFAGDMKASILSALSKNPISIDLSAERKGQVLMLKVYYSEMSCKAYLQLFEYIPHQYEPCSEEYEYDIEKITNLLK